LLWLSIPLFLLDCHPEKSPISSISTQIPQLAPLASPVSSTTTVKLPTAMTTVPLTTLTPVLPQRIAIVGKGLVHQVKISPDRKFYAVATWEGIDLFTADTHQPLRHYEVTGTGIDFSPDGSLLAVTVAGEIRILDLSSGEVLCSVLAPSMDSRVIISPDNQRFAILRRPSTVSGPISTSWVEVYDIQSQHLQYSFDEPPDGNHPQEDISYADLSFRPDGRYLAGAESLSGQVHVWDMADGSLVKRFLADTDLTSLSFSPNARWLAIGNQEHRVILFHADTLTWAATYSWFSNPIDGLTFSPDSSQITIDQGLDPAVVLDVQTGKKTQLTTRATAEAVLAPFLNSSGYYSSQDMPAISPNGKLIAIPSRGDTLLWDIERGAQGPSLDIASSNCLACSGYYLGSMMIKFSPDGKQLAASKAGNGIDLWNVDTSQIKIHLDTMMNYGFAFSPDGKLLMDWDGKDVEIWDIATGKRAWQSTVGEYLVENASFSADGKTVFVYDEYVRRTILLDATSGTVLGVYRDSSKKFQSKAVAFQGSLIVIEAQKEWNGPWDLEIWDMATQKIRLTIPNQGDMENTSISPDEGYIAITGKSTRLLDLATGKSAFDFPDGSSFLGFDATGRYAIVGNQNLQIEVWALP
jgi:WD40 repeat protein